MKKLFKNKWNKYLWNFFIEFNLSVSALNLLLLLLLDSFLMTVNIFISIYLFICKIILFLKLNKNSDFLKINKLNE